MLRIATCLLIVLAIGFGQYLLPDQIELKDVRLSPRFLNYQGYLTDTLGNPITGSFTGAFAIYDAASAGNLKWSEFQVLNVDKGIFHVLLGAGTPIPESVFLGGTNRWLELTVASITLSPRTRIVSVPYAYTSTFSDTALYARNYAPDNDWTRGTPDSVLFTVHGLGIARGGTNSVLLGTLPFTHTNLGTAYCTTGTAGQPITGSIVLGGNYNRAVGNYGIVIGGFLNRAGADYAMIGGGYTNTASGPYSFIGGGSLNTATMDEAVVGGGTNNTANGQYGAIIGGIHNTAGPGAVAAGGDHNTADNWYASVLGGYGNTANNYGSTVGGGYQNYAGGMYSAIAGGYADTINAAAHYSYLFGINSNLTQDSTFMVDLPHVWFGTEAAGYEFPRSRGSDDQVMATNASGQLAWADQPEASHWHVTDSVLYTDLRWGISRGGAGNMLHGTNAYSHTNLGAWACTTGVSGMNYTGCAVLGGERNIASGIDATVGGGYDNTASGSYSFVGGGFQNYASGQYSAVGSGYGVNAAGTRSFVGSGQYCYANGQEAVVGSGYWNEAVGLRSLVGTGYYNRNEGDYSVIIGGYGDTVTATADYSYLFGIRSKLTQDSTFMVDLPHVWFGTEAVGYEFPVSRGTDGQLLGTNGIGQLAWTAVSYVDSARIAAGAHKLQGKDTTALDVRYVNIDEAADGDLTGTYPDPSIADGAVTMAKINQASAANGQVIKWNGTAWTPLADNTDDAWIRGTPDSVLFTVRRLGIARGGAGNMLYGTNAYTHTNLGAGSCTTGTSGQNYGYITIGGGVANRADSAYGTIAGGMYNKAAGRYSSILGGSNNVASGYHSTISGGYVNAAGNSYSFIAGGYSNSATGYASAIGGGYQNTADSSYSSVGGGRDNSAAGQYTTISGGYTNSVTARYGAVGGGTYNSAGYYAAVSGGNNNTASATVSYVGGGSRNYCNGSYSAILGGYADTITTTGNYSYLFGINSNLTQDSTFMVDMPHVWFGTEAAGYEFPRNDGVSGQVLTTNGAGQLSWGTNYDNHWTRTGGKVCAYNLTDSVGIGTVSPLHRLHVAGESIAVYATASRTAGTGIVAAGNNVTPEVINGGSGAAFIGSGIGAYCKMNNTTGTGAGLNAVSGSPNGFGVWGRNTNIQGTGIAGCGNNVAIWYLSRGSGGAFSGDSCGAYARATDTYGTGVIAAGNNINSVQVMPNGSGGAFCGTTCGLYGVATNTTGSAYGVYGTVNNATGYGVWGKNDYPSGTGIVGTGNNAAMSSITCGSGGAFTGTNCGVYGRATRSDTAFAGYFYNDHGTYAYVAYYNGSTNYKIAGSGTVSTIMNTRSGRKTLFAPEMPSPYFQDIGEARLAGGHCRIDLDPLFLDCITVDENHPLRVVITPEDDCNGVYVKKNQTGFDVYELNRGRSDAAFTWVVYATWKDNEKLRFPDGPGPLEETTVEQPGTQTIEAVRAEAPMTKAGSPDVMNTPQ